MKKGSESCVLGVVVATAHWVNLVLKWIISVKHPEVYVNVNFRNTANAIWAVDNLGDFINSENPVTELGKNSNAIYVLWLDNLPVELKLALPKELGRQQCGSYFSTKS
eukprot:2980213-Rhodomonas_salina.2